MGRFHCLTRTLPCNEFRTFLSSWQEDCLKGLSPTYQKQPNAGDSSSTLSPQQLTHSEELGPGQYKMQLSQLNMRILRFSLRCALGA